MSRPQHTQIPSPQHRGTVSRRTWVGATAAGLLLPGGLSACRGGGKDGREDEASGETVLQLLQSGARYAMATSLEHGSRTRWVTEGLQKQVKHLVERTGAVEIDEKKVLKPEVNGDVAKGLLASADAILPRLHEAGDDLRLATDMVAWWIGAAHVVNPRSPLVAVPNDCAEQAARAIGSLHEITWAMEVLTTRLGADARQRSRRGIGHLQNVRRVVETLAGDAGPEQQVAYSMPREAMDKKKQGDRFRHFLDPWAKELRGQIEEYGDDAKGVHLSTVLLGTATGLLMDWNDHSTPSTPKA